MKKETQPTERSNAPVEQLVEPVVLPPARKTIERRGTRTEPYTRRLPQVRGGVCEFCGVIDPLVASQDQYRMCSHFRNIGELQCSYCPDAKSPTDVVRQSVLNVAEHPTALDENGNKVFVVWCNSYECSRKHEQRFKVSA